jgi:hypothetical protein
MGRSWTGEGNRTWSCHILETIQDPGFGRRIMDPDAAGDFQKRHSSVKDVRGMDEERVERIDSSSRSYQLEDGLW